MNTIHNQQVHSSPTSVSNAAPTKTDSLEAPRPANEDATDSTTIQDRSTRSAQTNAATLQAHLDVSMGSKNDPMRLVYKAALEGINEALEPTMGPDAAQKIQDNGIDVSPQATADRIISFSTAFFSQYQEQNQDMGLEEQVDSFLSLIGGGVDQGFSEAREILDGFGVLEGTVKEDIDKTYELVFEGYENFRDQILGKSEISDTANTPSSTNSNNGDGS
ncbi:MAG: DUF5610 domain-containing protein [Agarilytica sp.]